MSRPSVLWLLSLVLGLPAASWGGDVTRADGIVREVLAREATADVPDRGALLQGVMTQSPKLSAAQWAAGRIDAAGGWQSVADRTHELSADPRLAEYRAVRDANDLSPARHRELATWCAQRGLADQERAHLWALLADNANQTDLWKKLGYHLVDGQWLTTDEERELDRQWQQRSRDLKRWLPKAENIARRLSDANPTTRASAHEQLANLNDVAALPALETTLCSQSPELALEFIAWAKKRDRVETTHALARQAIVLPWDGVREMAIDSLRTRRLSDVMPVLLKPLSTPIERAASLQMLDRWGGGFVYRQVFRREFQNTVVLGLNEQRASVDGRVERLFERVAGDTTRFRGQDEQNRQTAVHVTRLTTSRVANDLARSAAAAEFQGAEAVAAANSAIDEINTRCQRALAVVTGETGPNRPEDWWNLWCNLQSHDPPADKKVIEIAEVQEQRIVISTPFLARFHGCFIAGTLVHTELGPRPIESVKIGDRVLAKDVDTGEVAMRPVLRTTVRSPQPLVKLSLKSETFQATRGHHFWVSGKGWRMARELQPGDRLHGLTGTATVTDIATGDVAAVYNLVVDRANTYFVGDSVVLSHDVTSPAPTNVKVPGLKE
jgi:hypothetical protein